MRLVYSNPMMYFPYLLGGGLMLCIANSQGLFFEYG